MGGSSSATILERAAFGALLADCVKNGGTPIVDLPQNHPIFLKSCVMIDLEKVKETFGINTRQWTNDEEDYGG